MGGPVRWPDGKRFAFTVFDDPDSQTLEDSQVVYGWLADLGFRTTKAVWPTGPYRVGNSRSETCDNPAYREHVRQLQRGGFEIGFHGASLQGSVRAETLQGLERFREYFGDYPSAMANHMQNPESIYWGPGRLSGARRLLYRAATLHKGWGRCSGERQGSPYFWGDACFSRVRYCRNFVFDEIDTLRACPEMPYHDPLRPFVRAWFASAEGSDAGKFVKTIAEANQDRLEEEGGACIMYTHFGKGFAEGGRLAARFQELTGRLSKKDGWFAPVSAVLDCIESQRGKHDITARERARLEWKWIAEKLVKGSA
jgi:hypothetical protein